ncbi:RNA-directed DNA polymerase, partial [Xanthomonas campestris pv. campestris]|nr:RNA-directed DNA polymerase [Xanthomonas campestris pv. campestris]MDO0864045.1 RNA-directed DNA polymerase [Xanthomonas campestris pv. campestris]
MPPLPDYASTELLLGLKTRKDLASWLGVSDRALRYMLYRLGDGDKYSTFSIRKRNGGLREIHAPK